MSVDAANVVVVVFAMPSCPACHEYLPRLRKQISDLRKMGYPIFEYQPSDVTRRGQVPVLIVDSTSADPSVINLADKYQVTALPTTIVLPRYGLPGRWEGALSDDETYHVLGMALNNS